MDARQAALDFVNDIRRAVHAPTLADLPLGFKMKANSCVIANALPGEDGSTCGEYAYVEARFAQYLAEAGYEVIAHEDPERPAGCCAASDQVAVPLPEDVETFTRLFDSGEYPELER